MVAKIAFAAIALVGLVFGLVMLWQSRQAQKAADLARSESKRLEAELLAAKTENTKYREILAKTRAAMDRAAQALESAGRDHAERIAQIDRADSNWLVCPLPDNVRNAFADDPDGMDPAAEVFPDVLRYSAGK